MRTREIIFHTASHDYDHQTYDIAEIVDGVSPRRIDKPLSVQLAGVSLCGEDYWIKRQGNSNVFALVMVTAGRGVLNTPVGRFEPTAGDVFLIHSRQSSDYRTDPRRRWRLLYFNLRGQLLDSLLFCYRLEDSWYFPRAGATRFFVSGLRALRCREHRDMDAAAVWILQLLQHLAHLVHPEHGAEAPTPDVELRMKTFIEDNCRSDLTLDRLTEISGCSVSQTIRRFRRCFGMTPYQYMLHIRINMAKHQLQSTTLTVKEIAWRLGFSDRFYFSTLFRRKTGMSPLAFRRSTS